MRFLLTFLICFKALATPNNVDKAFLVAKNQLSNPGFENGKAFWTASAGTFAIVTSGSNLLEGGVSATWDAAASSDTLSSTLADIPNGLYGKPGVGYCDIMTPSGTATHSLQVYDGTNILATQTVTSNTSPVRAYVHFLYPLSGQIRLRLYANADEPSISIDSCYLGNSEGVSLIPAKPQDMFSAKISSADAVSAENVDWINGNCTDATAGEQTCTFNSGIFTVAPNCACTNNTNGSGDLTCHVTAVSSTSVTFMSSNNNTNSDLDSIVHCQKAGVDSPSVAYKPDTLASSWSGYHDDTCSWPRTNTALGAPTDDASCALTTVASQNFGTVSTSGSVSPAITFTPKSAGRYLVTAQLLITGGSASWIAARMTDGTTTLADCSHTVAVGNGGNCTLQGIQIASSTSAITISIQTAANTGTVTIDEGSAANTGVSIRWHIVKLDQQIPSPLLVNSVVSKYSGVMGVETANLNCDAGSAITSQSGTWISSIGNVASGACTVTLAASVFSAAPTCFINDTVVVNPANILSASATSSTSVTIDCDAAATGTDCTAYDVNFMCIGPR